MKIQISFNQTKKQMRNISYFHSLTPEWQAQFVRDIKGELINDKIISIPESIGQGYYYFTSVKSYISVIYMDFTPKIPLKIHRHKSDNELYIFHFDLSDEANSITVNKSNYKIGSNKGSGILILDNQVDSSFQPVVGKRIFALRLLVDKKKMDFFLNNRPIGLISKSKKNIAPQKFVYYYNKIESKSIIALKSIMNKSIFELSFDSYLKGTSLKLLANFLNKQEHLEEEKTIINKTDSQRILCTKNYIVKNLHEPFPSISFLANMAGMSVTKYKILFKKHLATTPKKIYVTEKFLLAKKMIESGKYSLLSEVMHELNYNNVNYFKTQYTIFFRKSPAKSFPGNAKTN